MPLRVKSTKEETTWIACSKEHKAKLVKFSDDNNYTLKSCIETAIDEFLEKHKTDKSIKEKK